MQFKMSSGMSVFNSGNKSSPVSAFSIRSSKERMMRNELGTIPLAMPECAGEFKTETRTVSAMEPLND